MAIKIVYENKAVGVTGNVTNTASDKQDFVDLTELDDSSVEIKNYGTLEGNNWLLTDDVVSILQGIFNSNGFLIVTICAIFAGFGLGLALKGGASTGGTDIVQAILYKYANMPYSKSLILVDGSIVLIGAAVLYFTGIVPAITSIISVLYALVYILLSGYMMDQVVFSGFNVRAVHIVTCEKEKVEDYILRKLERGVTVLKAKGAYTGEDRDMLVTVLSQREYYALKDTVYSIDPKAFVYVVKASEVHGEGFSYDSFEQ